jgi:hypothetical protein
MPRTCCPASDKERRFLRGCRLLPAFFEVLDASRMVRTVLSEPCHREREAFEINLRKLEAALHAFETALHAFGAFLHTDAQLGDLPIRSRLALGKFAQLLVM